MSTPENLELVPREIEIDIEAVLKRNRYYVDNDPVRSHFWSALQCVFPEGERFFIDSARDVRDGYQGKLPATLEKQIKTFIHQEAHHGTHHENMNRVLIDLGYTRVAEYSEQIKNMRTNQRTKVPALTRLAMTMAGEHFTAVMGRIQLHDDPSFFDSLDPGAQPLFLYHAMEEIEHKAVCYDLYQVAGGGYFRRVLTLFGFMIGLTVIMRKMHIYMLKKDGLWNKQTKRQARKEIWGFKGLAWKLVPSIIAYLNPNFHPWNHDDREWLAKDYSEKLDDYGLEMQAVA